MAPKYTSVSISPSGKTGTGLDRVGVPHSPSIRTSQHSNGPMYPARIHYLCQSPLPRGSDDRRSATGNGSVIFFFFFSFFFCLSDFLPLPRSDQERLVLEGPKKWVIYRPGDDGQGQRKPNI